MMLICLLFYNLDKKKHAAIVEGLKQTSVNTNEIEDEKGSLDMLENVVESHETTVETTETPNAEVTGEPAEISSAEKDGENE